MDIPRKELNGKVAIVTGGARGIGRAVAESLAESGAEVVIADLDKKAAETLAAKLPKSIGIMTDVASEASITELYAKLMERFGRVDILVNNAGIFRGTPVLELEAGEWDTVMAVNLRGTFLMCREALKIMQAQNGGKIVNLASMSGKTGGVVAGAHYSASKAGVICLTKSLAAFAAPFKVNVNAITPGLIKTDLTEQWGVARNRALTANIPLREFGTPENVADAVLFLISNRASYITGEILDVNGGMLMD